MKKPKIAVQQALDTLESTGDYRVLRRLKHELLRDALQRVGFEPAEAKRAIYLDTETTGFDKKKHEIIELAMVPFWYAPDGRIVSVEAGMSWYQQPSVPITPEITALTGISNEDVAGKGIDWDEVSALVNEVGLIVAHNAEFDRGFVELKCETFKSRYWACSVAQVPWTKHGVRGNKLDYIVQHYGHFFEAHRADVDCLAGVFALAQPLGGVPAMKHLLDNARAEGRHIWALNAPFDAKDILKERGYQWSGGEDGKPKAWHREVTEAEYAAEATWLSTKVYRRAPGLDGSTPWRVARVTAQNRFTDRVY